MGFPEVFMIAVKGSIQQNQRVTMRVEGFSEVVGNKPICPCNQNGFDSISLPKGG